MGILSIISLFGGLAMFLYGIEVMGDGLKSSSGAALKKFLEKATNNLLLGVLTGTIVTAVIQSSTATIVLTVALIGAGILDLRQGVSIAMGANIGTTITSQIIRLASVDASGNPLLNLFKAETLAPLALVAGIVLIMFVKRGAAKSVGNIFIGFGILFSGIMNMTAAVKPLSESAEFAELLLRLSKIPIVGILAGVGSTIIIQSSSAVVGILQTIADATGAVTFSLAYPIIMGSNIGTCIVTATLCSIGATKDGKRTGFVHILFNLFGTVLIMLGLSILHRTGIISESYWVSTMTSGSIADFHTLTKLITCALLLPFTNQLIALSKLVIRDDAPAAQVHPELHTLDSKLLISPALALNEATRAVASMGNVARQNFKRSCLMLSKYNDKDAALILSEEDCLDQFAETADYFLVDLSKRLSTDAEDTQLNLLMQTVPNFERIGDYATNILEFSQKMQSEKLQFSKTAREELALLGSAVNEILNLTISAFDSNDNEAAKSVEPLEEIIDDMVLLLRDRHTERLRSGQCTINAGLIFLEVLTYMERASDQCSSTAAWMLSRADKSIAHSHHDYLKQIHQGNDSFYRQEYAKRREEYILPLQKIE